jgi:hypothetical protein
MTISATDLLTENGGRLPPSFFSGESTGDYERRLDVFLATGAKAATDGGATDLALIDGVAEAWAYYAAYDEKVQAMAAAPASVSFADGEGAQSFSADQRAIFERRAAEWLATYEARLEEAIPAEEDESAEYTTVRSFRSRC